jgi:hypothetical protein
MPPIVGGAQLIEWTGMTAKTEIDTTAKLLFLLEAQLFHGCTRKEALMLWNDGITTLHDRVESIN